MGSVVCAPLFKIILAFIAIVMIEGIEAKVNFLTPVLNRNVKDGTKRIGNNTMTSDEFS